MQYHLQIRLLKPFNRKNSQQTQVIISKKMKVYLLEWIFLQQEVCHCHWRIYTRYSPETTWSIEIETATKFERFICNHCSVKFPLINVNPSSPDTSKRMWQWLNVIVGRGHHRPAMLLKNKVIRASPQQKIPQQWSAFLRTLHQILTVWLNTGNTKTVLWLISWKPRMMQTTVKVQTRAMEAVVTTASVRQRCPNLLRSSPKWRSCPPRTICRLTPQCVSALLVFPNSREKKIKAASDTLCMNLKCRCQT